MCVVVVVVVATDRWMLALYQVLSGMWTDSVDRRRGACAALSRRSVRFQSCCGPTAPPRRGRRRRREQRQRPRDLIVCDYCHRRGSGLGRWALRRSPCRRIQPYASHCHHNRDYNCSKALRPANKCKTEREPSALLVENLSTPFGQHARTPSWRRLPLLWVFNAGATLKMRQLKRGCKLLQRQKFNS